MGTVEPITQKELKEFYQKKLEFEKLEGEMKTLKQGFSDRKALGAQIEAGPFELTVTPVVQNRVNDKMLIEAIAKEFGQVKAEELRKGALKESKYDMVSVKPTS